MFSARDAIALNCAQVGFCKGFRLLERAAKSFAFVNCANVSDWDNMVVHHKLSLFRGGTNRNSNLIVMDKKYHAENNKALHWYPEGQNPYGLD